MSFSTTGSVFAKRTPRKQALNILVCGASGTGKSSFINTLVGRRVIFESESSTTPSTQVRFQPTTTELEEPLSDGSRLVLTLIETEGFGRNIEHSEDIGQVANFIEHKFDEVLAEESRIRRNPRFKDNRIDACVYLIEPTGHGLRELDVLMMKRLSSIVNIIPVLARADTLTPAERVSNKRLVSEDMRYYDIEVFDFQYADEMGEPHPGSSVHTGEGEKEDNELYSSLPFAVVSSSEFNDQGDALFKRLLSYGTVDVLNSQHCDFKILREALLDGFLSELKDRTHEVLYETFRTHRLDPQQNHRASLLMPQELADHAARLKQAQIDRETFLLREEERRVNAEIENKRALLLKRERELRELEQRMAQAKPFSGTKQTSQPSSATSTTFSAAGQSIDGEFGTPIPEDETSSTPATATAPAPAPAASTNPFAQTEKPVVPGETSHDQHGQPGTNADDGYVDGPATEEETPETTAAATQLRVRQSRSRQELRNHTDKLQAELGSLESQKQSIQRQVASQSTRSLHSQLANDSPAASSTSSLNHHGDHVPPALNLSHNQPSDDDANRTSPLNIKKTTTA